MFNMDKEKLQNLTKKLGKQAANLGASGLKKGAELAKQGARYTYDHREELVGAAVGLGKGTVEAGKGLYGHTIKEEDIEEKISELKEQSEEYSRLSKIYADKLAQVKTPKEIIADSLFTSTAFLAEYYNTGTIPADVAEAYRLAFPNLSQQQPLSSVIETASPQQIEGYVNVIKGKLFEMRYADYLNSGNLPDGYTAVLAQSPVNPGWDLQIVDAMGNAAQNLQMKATDSISYVHDALMRYPGIDVVTTEEVYNQLALSGMAEHVINSGITNEELASVVTQSLDVADFQMDFMPSIIPFLIIGYSVSRKDWLNAYEKGKEFGARSVSSWIAYIAGGAVTGLTGFWLGGLGAVFLTNYGLEAGRAKLSAYSNLKTAVQENNDILNRLKYKISMV